MRQPDPSSPLAVLVVAPRYMIGGQAHAAQQIVQGFSSDDRMRVALQPIDPRLPGALGFLTSTRYVRSVVRPLLLCTLLLRNAHCYDVIHTFAAAHSAFWFGAMPALIVGRLLGRPVVLNYHDGRAAEHLRRSPRLMRWAIGQAAALVVPSGFLQAVFIEAGFRPDVVPNVVDLRRFAFRHPGPLRPRLISVRLLETLYAVENTIRAFAIAREALPGLTLDIYGDGHARQLLEEEAERVGSDGITFHGGVPHEEIPAILGAGGVLVNSSRVDNMPLFVIEGFAAGVPVVTSAAGGIPFMVTDNTTGLLVAPDDPSALAAAVLRLFREPGLADQLSANARAECVKYDWATAREDWIRIYKSAVGAKPAARVAS